MEKCFETDVAEQRKKVALDLLDKLQRTEKQRDALLAACRELIGYVAQAGMTPNDFGWKAVKRARAAIEAAK